MKKLKFNWMIVFLAGIFLSGLLCSCKPYYGYSYTITNSADTLVVVHYRVSMTNLRTDTFIAVKKDETKLLFIREFGIKGKGPRFRDIDKDFELFTVTKKATRSKRNYLANESWIFTVLNNREGEYKTIVTDSEF